MWQLVHGGVTGVACQQLADPLRCQEGREEQEVEGSPVPLHGRGHGVVVALSRRAIKPSPDTPNESKVVRPAAAATADVCW